jgi:Uma2 family endonuclease
VSIVETVALPVPATPDMTAVVSAGQHFTLDDLAGLPDGEDTGLRYELIDGELHMTTQPHWLHQGAAGVLFGELFIWSRANDTGRPYMAPGVVFSPEHAVAPDVVWVRRERLAALLHPDGKLHGPPDLVVEVLSPGPKNAERDRVTKRDLYALYAVPEYWIIDLDNQQVAVYRLVGGRLELELEAEYGVADTLTSPRLPGFFCAVADIVAD